MQILRLLGDRVNGTADAFKLLIQERPDARLNRVRVLKEHHLDDVALPNSIESPHALVEAHGIPREVDVDQTRAVLLKINALARRFGGNEEANRARIETVLGRLARLAEVAQSSGRGEHAW